MTSYRWGEGPEFETIKDYTCENCGKELTASPKDAHVQGWDVYPYFSAGVVVCGDCPAMSVARYRNMLGLQ
jgi:hypothetical protein